MPPFHHTNNRVPQEVPEMWRKRAATSISADSPSGKRTTLVRRWISFMIRSSGLFVPPMRLGKGIITSLVNDPGGGMNLPYRESCPLDSYRRALKSVEGGCGWRLKREMRAALDKEILRVVLLFLTGKRV